MTLSDLAARLRRGLGISADDAAILMEKITPVIQLDRLLESHHHHHQDERGCIGSGNVTSAATRAILQLQNPLGSGVLAYVERVCVAASGIATLAIAFNDTVTLSGPISTLAFRDDRAQPGLPACLLRGQDVAVPAGSDPVHQAPALANTPYNYPLGITLSEGNSLLVYQTSGTNNLYANFHWTEKVNPRP